MTIRAVWGKRDIQSAFRSFRKSSEGGPEFPYKYNVRNGYIEVFPDGVVRPVIHFKADVGAAFDRAKRLESVLIIGWVGQWRTDQFVVDDPEKLIP